MNDLWPYLFTRARELDLGRAAHLENPGPWLHPERPSHLYLLMLSVLIGDGIPGFVSRPECDLRHRPGTSCSGMIALMVANGEER